MKPKTENSPMISVIVPVYNSEKTLKRCVDSILSQSLRDFELILVDDGSCDSSSDIAENYRLEDYRVKVFHQPNKGVSAARNLGLSHAVGEFVAFCDSDDRVRRDWLSSMFSEIGKTDMVVGGYNIYRLDVSTDPVPVKETLGSVQMFSRADRILEILLKAKLLQFVWNKLFRRQIIEKYGLRFNESFSVFEDEYFVLGYLAHAVDVICVPHCGYDYFLPADFYTKYDFGIDAFQEVVNLIYKIVAEVPGRVRLPSIVYWYKIALGRYAATHSFVQTRERIEFARTLADNFHDGPFNHLLLRILPSRCVYDIVKKKTR